MAARSVLREKRYLLSSMGAGRRTTDAATSSSAAEAMVKAPPALRAAPEPSEWRLTRRLPAESFALFRAAARGDLGPGCYVLKTCRPEHRASDVAASLLQREAAVAACVAHANLIPVLSADRRDHFPRLMLPYLEGVTLRRLLNGPSRPLPVVKALSICRQVAEGLSTLHAAGWLHGQVRPQHILVSPQGHVTLIDLTHAHRLDSCECDGAASFLNAGQNASLAYAAPESFASRGRLTPAADVYALGIVLFETLTGRPPFEFTSQRQLLQAHRCSAPPDLRQLRFSVSLEVAQLVRRILAKEPLRRPSAEQLVQWLAELEIAELPHSR